MTLVKDPRERFSATAADYARFRPSYPTALLDWIVRVSGVPSGGRIADIGCGTGISSRFFAAAGYRVVGIDPNEDMLAHARAAGGGDYRRGEATATGLADASIDLITVAQAFHWFPLVPTLAEFARILVPDGWACVFWNIRATSPFNDEYERLLLRHSSEYPELARRDDASKAVAARPGAREAEFPNDDLLGWDALIGRIRSASYVAHSVADMSGFERAVREAYDRHVRPDGTVLWATRTAAIACPVT